MDSAWSVYLVRCGDGSLYTGITTDVERRMTEHASGRRGAKYLRGRGPLQLAFQYRVSTRSVATRIERRIKRLSAADKQDVDALARLIENMLHEGQ